ncbi:MAG TPA: galactokinase family protein [Ruminococcus sp.]|nr:galactokinase family protein [Ruminococcus sp.]
MEFSIFINGLSSGAFDHQFVKLYGNSEKTILRQRARFMSAAEKFSSLFPESSEISVFSAPGRTEIGGNHTDHQHGCVVAAAVSADIIALVSYNDEGVIRIVSDGYEPINISLDKLSPENEETGTSAALIRGIASAFSENGTEIGGFNSYITSDIPDGSGLSSSAAFEILIGNIIDKHYNRLPVGAEKLAFIGNYAENSYFGKKSGIMDQLVCSLGGFVFLDLEKPDSLIISQIDLNFRSAGYALCITNTQSSHSSLSSEYSAIVSEMCHVAEMLGCSVLREADENDFYERLPELRDKCSDRELLRAAHFFSENKRASLQAEALNNGDTEGFFELVNESGQSSAMLLQNIFAAGSPEYQPISLALMMSKKYLSGSGAVRVHGGGFGGTIQAFVPNYMVPGYIKEMERLFGTDCCSVLNIRSVGGYEFLI